MPWIRNLRVRLLVTYLAALALLVFGLYLYAESAVRRLYLETVSDTALQEARLVATLLPWDLRGPELDERCRALRDSLQARITVIEPDGRVAGDSDFASSALENQRNLPEVSAAFLRGEGGAIRGGAETGGPALHRAVRQRLGGRERVVRVARPLAAIEDTLAGIRTALWSSGAAAAAAAVFFVLLLSRQLTSRLTQLTRFSEAVARGEVPPPLTPERDDVLGGLESNLLRMAETLQAQLEEAREDRNRLEAILRGMVEGVLVVDRSGTVQLANRRAEQLLNASGDRSLSGQPLISVSRDPDLQELAREGMRGSLHGPIVRELVLDRGRREYLQVTASTLGDPHSETDGFIFVFHDVTELKQLEATRRDFVANVSHELKTPLTAIRGYAETLRTGALADKETAARFVDIIERNAERLSRLIEDLLILSDLELGRAPLHPRSVAVGALIDAALEVVQRKAKQGSVRVQADVPADMPPVAVDPDRLEQVLVNLVDNAVKYTGPGGTVTVGARLRNGNAQSDDDFAGAGVDASATWLELCIADTGIGIPSQDVPRLTERFYRVDRARSRELGGTGLGLAIVKHIVQLHGGILRIESELGRGTDVYVYIPVPAEAPGLTAPRSHE